MSASGAEPQPNRPSIRRTIINPRVRTTTTATLPDRINAAHARCRRAGTLHAKGERVYDWAWVRITPPVDEAVGHHWLLIRRNITTGERAYYRCWSPTRVGLKTLVRVAGTRWNVKECFQTSKGEVGLDQHQVRTWDSWHRYTTLAMFAHAILAVIAAHERNDRPNRTL